LQNARVTAFAPEAAPAPVTELPMPLGHKVLVAVVTADVATSAAFAATRVVKPWKFVVAASEIASRLTDSTPVVVPTGQYEFTGHAIGMEHEPEVPVVPGVALVHAAAVPVATGR